jgi:hypothetical protein
LGAPAVDLYSDELPVASPLAAAVLELELVAARPAAVPMDWARLLGDGKGGVNSHARAQSHFHFLFHQPVPNDVLEAFQFAVRARALPCGDLLGAFDSLARLGVRDLSLSLRAE